jgi:hypothetical protein
MIPTIFGIRPSYANLYYEMPGYTSGKAANDIPSDRTIAALAWEYARKIGLDTNELSLKNFYTHFRNADEDHPTETNVILGRGVFLSRQLDGIKFFSGDEQGDGAEGFIIEFGNGGKIRTFSLCWSEVKRSERELTVGPSEGSTNLDVQQRLISTRLAKTGRIPNIKKVTGVRPKAGDGRKGVTGVR